MATERGYYRFTVKEWADGSFWLAAEPASEEIIPSIGDGLGFNLMTSTTHEQAKRLADEMNKLIVSVLLS